jgi:hypothetical protein
MGVLAPHLRTFDGSARPPIDTIRNFPVHMSPESPLNITPNLAEVISEVSTPYDYFTTTPPPPLPTQICYS